MRRVEYGNEGKKLDKELVSNAKDFYQNKKSNSLVKNEFIEGDIIEHTAWGKGEIKKVLSNKGVYEILFFDIDKTKPINFGYDKMTLIKKSDNPQKENDLIFSSTKVDEKEETDNAFIRLFKKIIK